MIHGFLLYKVKKIKAFTPIRSVQKNYFRWLKKRKIRRLKLSSILLINLGIICLTFALWQIINEQRINSLPQPVIVEEQQDQIPVKISIPDLNITSEIKPAQIIDTSWQVSENFANYLLSSSTLNGSGNIIVYGHNKKELFGNLPKISKGSKIYLYDQENTEYLFEVKELSIVKEDNLTYVQPSQTLILTVYTCYGFMDRQRFVVQALPASLDQINPD